MATGDKKPTPLQAADGIRESIRWGRHWKRAAAEGKLPKWVADLREFGAAISQLSAEVAAEDGPTSSGHGAAVSPDTPPSPTPSSPSDSKQPQLSPKVRACLDALRATFPEGKLPVNIGYKELEKKTDSQFARDVIRRAAAVFDPAFVGARKRKRKRN